VPWHLKITCRQFPLQNYPLFHYFSLSFVFILLFGFSAGSVSLLLWEFLTIFLGSLKRNAVQELNNVTLSMFIFSRDRRKCKPGLKEFDNDPEIISQAAATLASRNISVSAAVHHLSFDALCQVPNVWLNFMTSCNVSFAVIPRFDNKAIS